MKIDSNIIKCKRDNVTKHNPNYLCSQIYILHVVLIYGFAQLVVPSNHRVRRMVFNLHSLAAAVAAKMVSAENNNIR